jgi:hypothetical protein
MSTTSVLPLAIISRACIGVILGTAALAASIICLTLEAMASSSPSAFTKSSNLSDRSIAPFLPCPQKVRLASDSPIKADVRIGSVVP